MNFNLKKNNINHRAELDGLRGLSVIAVLFYEELEKIYYSHYIKEKGMLKSMTIYELNKKINKISKKLNVKYVDLSNLVCDKKNKTCKFLLENKDELHRDYGRYSVNGPKYLGKLIYNKIVNLDD